LRIEIGELTTKHASSKWSDVYIFPDLTSKECKQNKQLHEQLRARKAAGDKDLYIKFGRIVPCPPYLVGGTQN